MKTTDRVFQKMVERGLTDVDDVTHMSVSKYVLAELLTEQRELNDMEGITERVTVADLEDFFGAKIVIDNDIFNEDGFKFLREV